MLRVSYINSSDPEVTALSLRISWPNRARPSAIFVFFYCSYSIKVTHGPAYYGIISVITYSWAKITVAHSHVCHLLCSYRFFIHKVLNQNFSISSTLSSHKGVFHTYTHAYIRLFVYSPKRTQITPELIFKILSQCSLSLVYVAIHLVPRHSVDHGVS